MPLGARILGEGVAARTAARLLAGAGREVWRSASPRPPLPVILLGAATRNLLRDVFQTPDLLSDLLEITQREVLWRPPGPSHLLPHSAYSTSEEELLASLPAAPSAGPEPAASFTLHAQRPLPAETAEHRFGERFASLARVRRKASAPVCQMEATSAGWLFLIPARDPDAWLIAVGGPLESQLAESRLIAPGLADCEAQPGRFPTAPRLAWPLAGPGWLACGSAAATFDPICGDGTAFAVREGILAAAVFQADALPAALAHYETRLLAAFAKHLALSREYYSSGPATDWWRAQVSELDRGLAWCQLQLNQRPAPQFRLQDSTLVPL
jgi:hypothetical protein